MAVPKKEKQLTQELTAIYTDEAGQMPDFTKLEQEKRSHLTRILVRSVIALVLVSGAAWAGFFFWRMNWFGDPKILAASIEGPTEVNAGDEVIYTVQYHNPGSVPVSGLSLTVNLPSGFHLDSSIPPASNGMTWNIGTVTPGSDGSIALKGTFRAVVPSRETIQVAFGYRPANFNSDFQDFRSKVVDVTGSVLSTVVNGPEKALPGDDVAYKIEVTNDGPIAVEKIQIRAELPRDFHLKKSEPAVSTEDRVAWDVARIEPGATSAITLHGSYTATAEGDQALTATVALAEDGGIKLAQGSAVTHTDVIGGVIDFHLIVNGGSDDLTTDLGSSLHVSIPYRNDGSDAMENVSLKLALEPKNKLALPIKWDTSIGAGKEVRTGNNLTWNATNRPELARLDPKASGTIDLTLPLVSSINPDTMADGFTMTLVVTIGKVGSVISARTISATPIQVALNSDFAATAEARYFTEIGEPVGTGPLPPQVGQTTTYRVFWNMTNTLHPLSGVRMTTNLPPGVGWIDQKDQTGGTLTFDPTTRIVTWQVGDLPAGTQSLDAWFQVAIDPDAADVGSFYKLTNATSARAVDATTKGELAQATDQLTTELANDPLAKGKGIVVKE